MDTITAGAAFSPCRTYRYSLTRAIEERMIFVEPRGTLLVIGLNPSTADETKNDPTVKRLMHRASVLGFDRLVVCNLFAFRATDPAVMRAAADPVGPDNDHFLLTEAAGAAMVLAAWGNHGTHNGRARFVRELLEREKPLHALRLTSIQEPEHPLYLPYSLAPFELERLSPRQEWEKP
jgi:hypothetical protein